MNRDTPLVRKLMARQDLTRAEAGELLASLLRTDAEGWRFLAFSVASQTKGETVDELLGLFDAMAAATGSYDLGLPAGAEVLDVASSGGSGRRKINVSTLSALVVGEPGLPVLKQSFWGITSVTGSANVLQALGILVPAATRERLAAALREVGIGFYSPLFLSPELANLVHFGQVLGTRAIGVNTPFNLVAPLFTPVRLTCRLFGINNPGQLDLIVELCRGLGYRSAAAVHGLDGLDEVSLAAPTRLRGFRDGEELDLQLTPEQAGLATVPAEALAPEDARSNVRDFLRIAHGEETGPKRDLVAFNAGVALWLAGRAGSVRDGVEIALARLAAGRAAENLAALTARLGSPEVLAEAKAEHLAGERAEPRTGSRAGAEPREDRPPV
jgi:anthranilate phosphoribosyltransferase